MAERACHAFGSTTRFGLTQALGRMESTSEMPDRLDLFARIICIILGAVFAFAAWLAYTSSGPAIVHWLCGVGAIVLLTAGTFGPRSLRVGLVTWLPWFWRWTGLTRLSSRSRVLPQ